MVSKPWKVIGRLAKTGAGLLLGMVVLVGTGCGLLVPESERLPLHRQMGKLPPGPLCVVAVLPFVNDSEYPLGDVVAAKAFAAEFRKSGNYQAIQEGDVYKVYQQLRMLPGETLTPEELQIVAARLGAQVLITGVVMEMRENRESHGSINPVVALDVQIRDGRSGDVLWSTYHRRQGTEYRKAMHFGTIHTVTGVSRQVAEEIINLWSEKGIAQCDVSPRS